MGVVNATSRPLYSQERLGTHRIEGPLCMSAEKFGHTGI